MKKIYHNLKKKIFHKKKHHTSIKPTDVLKSNYLRSNKKNKISWFYKIHFSALLILSLILIYFVILVSAKPKSIPYITKKIEVVLKEKFGNEVSLENSYLSFTRYGTIKIGIDNLKILHPLSEKNQKQEFIIPKLETEFSLFSLLSLSFRPNKIKIINPEIIIDKREKEHLISNNTTITKTNDASVMIGILSSVKNRLIPVKTIEIENAKISFKNNKISAKIVVKSSQVRLKSKNKNLQIISISQINFGSIKKDINLKSICNLYESNDLSCEVALENFAVNSIASAHPALNNLKQINAFVDTAIFFRIVDGEIGNLTFKVSSAKGDFSFADFFNKKIDFAKLSIDGEYDKKLGILNISKIKSDLFPDKQNYFDYDKKPNLEMSLIVSDLNNKNHKKLDFYIKLENIANNQIDQLWPSALNQNGIRDWVINHIKDGLLKNAYTKFSLVNDINENRLEEIDAKIIFTDFDLDYDEYFPRITNLSGIANFTKDQMKISIAEGDVLNSKISDGLVLIEDFNSQKKLLKISGKFIGDGADSLKHANYQSLEFTKQLEKYLNGNSKSIFNIQIPLDNQIDLKNTYISINSTIEKLNNPFVKGNLTINSTKNFDSNDFVTKVDLTNSALDAKFIDIEKKPLIDSGLDLIVSIANSESISLKNIFLWKKEKDKNNSSIISGNVEIALSPFSISSIDLKNKNFGKNNYSLSYKTNKKLLYQKLSLIGKRFNSSPLLSQKFFADSAKSSNLSKLYLRVNIDDLILLKKKSLKNFSLSLNCKNNFCYSGNLKGSKENKQIIDLRANKKTEDKEEFISIDGKVGDIGYLAEALGISNLIVGGDAKVKLRNKMIGKKQVLSGEITINNDITFYENAAVKRLAKNDLFSQIKDKIFSNQKTTFDSVKLEFYMQDNLLYIKSFIANNYKIGITAKGFVDLKNKTYQIKGMIVPGFIINNLFGIGKIPIIGNVISGLLTGGQGGGLFGIRYSYIKTNPKQEAIFETYKISAFVPTTIKNLFDW